MWWNGKDAESTSARYQSMMVVCRQSSSGTELWSELAPFLRVFATPFFFLEKTADKRQLLKLGYLAEMFTKMIQVNLSCQRKQLRVSVANQFWKTCTCYSESASFSILEKLLDEIGGNMNKCDFFDLVQWNVSIFERSAQLREPIFSEWPMGDVTKSLLNAEPR